MGLMRFIPDNPIPQDYISLMLKEILRSLPSTHSFSVQLFVTVWNQNQAPGGTQIGQNEDIYNLSDLILGNLPLLYVNASTPAITEFRACYNCQCGHQEQNMQDWTGKSFERLPPLNVGQSAAPVPVGQLVTNLLQTLIPLRCSNPVCGRAVNAIYQVKKGKYTVLRFDRFHHSNWGQVLHTKLSVARTNTAGEQYLGRLISVISHVGDNQGGHYVSYTEVSGSWYRNSDADPVRRVNFDPLNSRNPNETANFLVFDNS